MTDTRSPVLVADIGGTHTRMALAVDGCLLPETIRRFENSDHADLGPVLIAFLRDVESPLSGVCLAVAGIVGDGSARMTNLDWTIEDEEISALTGCKNVVLVNDLQAQGHALGHLPASKQRVLVPADPDPSATKLVVGLGTGFNAAAVFETDAGRLVPPSETGHADLVVQSEREMDFVRFLVKKLARAEIEDALSGQGLENIFEWVSGRRRTAEQIMAALNTGEDARSDRTLDLFTDLLARALASLCLTHLPYGGVYLVGGVARAVAPHLERFDFASRLHDRGRFSSLLHKISVSIVLDDHAALTGCAAMQGNRRFTAP